MNRNCLTKGVTGIWSKPIAKQEQGRRGGEGGSGALPVLPVLPASAQAAGTREPWGHRERKRGSGPPELGPWGLRAEEGGPLARAPTRCGVLGKPLRHSGPPFVHLCNGSNG